MRQHFPALDGLRGTAALSVVLYHYVSVTLGLRDPDMLWIPHAHIAVDFFYCLSGYVIALAYQDRIARMGVGGFMRTRIIRLHPMVVAGTLFGLLGYLLDPDIFSSAIPAPFRAQPGPEWKVAMAAVSGMVMIPSWPLPTRLESYFPLNGPAWSLMWEYVASAAYGLVLWRLNRTVIGCLAALAAVGLFSASHGGNGLNIGWGWGQELPGLARVSFSFLAGILLYQWRTRISARLGIVALSIILILLFAGPDGLVAPWLYEASVVVFVFPLIVAMGAGAPCGPRMIRVCDVMGRLSYPLYLLNFPITMAWMSFYWSHALSVQTAVLGIAALTLATIAFAYTVLVLYDEPFRRRLQARTPTKGTPSITSAA